MNTLFIASKFEKSLIKLVQVMVIFVSGTKTKKMNAEDEEKYKEKYKRFEEAYLKDGWTDLAHIWNGKCLTPRDIAQKNALQLLLRYKCVKIMFSWFL